MLTAITVTWLTMNTIGQWSLLFLLGTIAWVKALPQRNNPFLINLILTTFLATIPPCMLLVAGHQDDVPPYNLCLVQAVLMDGVAPMFGTALVVLVFHTWCGLRATLCGVTPITIRYPAFKLILLLFPYLTMASWCTASTVVALDDPLADPRLSVFVYCANNSHLGSTVRKNVGPFMLACGAVEVFFDVWIAHIVFPSLKFWRSRRSKRFTSPHYEAHTQIYVRILIFSLLQLTPILLALLQTNHTWSSSSLNKATQILESMDALATFLVFGTQRDILRVWRFWGSKKGQEPDPVNMMA